MHMLPVEELEKQGMEMEREIALIYIEQAEIRWFTAQSLKPCLQAPPTYFTFLPSVPSSFWCSTSLYCSTACCFEHEGWSTGRSTICEHIQKCTFCQQLTTVQMHTHCYVGRMLFLTKYIYTRRTQIGWNMLCKKIELDFHDILSLWCNWSVSYLLFVGQGSYRKWNSVQQTVDKHCQIGTTLLE